jgi:uncharacterized membrane protein
VALAVVVGAALIATVAFALLGLQVQRTLHTSALDLAMFDQILWNTAHGHWFASSYTLHQYNFLGQHFEIGLIVLAGLYRLGAGPAALIVLQAIGVGAAAIVLFAVARSHGSAVVGTLLALAFLLSPQLERAVDFGFHPDLFIPLLAFAAYWAHRSGRTALLLVLCAGLLTIKEDASLVVLGLGCLAFVDGRRRLGLALMLVGLAWAVLVPATVMAHLRAGYADDLAERYGYLGTTPMAIVTGALLHPDRVIGHLAQPGVAATVCGLLAVTGFLPLFTPEGLLAAAPPALLGLLATHPEQRALDLHYSAPVLALLFIAAARGSGNVGAIWRAVAARLHARRLLATLPPRRVALALPALALCCAAVGYAVRGPYPGGGAHQAWRFSDNGDAAALARVERLIPANATLSAQTGLLPHLAQRSVEWEFPRLEDAAYVVIEDGGIVSQQSLGTYGGYDATRAALPTLGYAEIDHDHGIHLYKRTVVVGQ